MAHLGRRVAQELRRRCSVQAKSHLFGSRNFCSDASKWFLARFVPPIANQPLPRPPPQDQLRKGLAAQQKSARQNRIGAVARAGRYPHCSSCTPTTGCFAVR